MTMNRRILAIACLLVPALLLSLPTAPRADHWIWFDSIGLRGERNESVTIVPGSPEVATRIIASGGAGDYWVHAQYTLPSTVLIDSVVVCYQNQGDLSYIRQTRIG